MTEVLHFTGFIKGVAYKTYLAEKEKLKAIKLENFDANTSPSYGIIDSHGTKVSYSKWVSPKRTRSYPFARIYNTYNFSKVITIIPVLKDEGSDGDRDLIQYSTFSWMNLLNIYIVLAYYEGAEKSYKKNQENKNKLTKQQFNNDFIKVQIDEIFTYHQSALHWNRSLLENKFTQTFEKALDSYDKISTETNVKIHSSQIARKTLKKFQEDFEEFKNISHKASQSASKREALVSHKLEYLVDGKKSTFSITNYLGGVYYLTPDEIIDEIDKNNRYIIQESKNTSESNLPKLPDIQDGLFKLILFSNLHELKLNERIVNFVTKLKLTGKNINGSLVIPAATEVLEAFLENNTSNFSETEKIIIKKLVLEVGKNQNLLIEISGNSNKEKNTKELLIKSPLRYPGGKSKAIPQIAKYLPPNFSEYREPFVGGGALFIYLKQKFPDLKIWINDLNTELFLFWKYAQTNLSELIEEIRRVKLTKTDGRLLFQELTEVNVKELSNFERAVRFFVLNRITFSGTVESGGFSMEAFHKRFTDSSIDRLAVLDKILDSVTITNLDYSELLKPIGKDIFIFLDPPYFAATKSKLYGKRGYLHTSFDHKRFADELRQCPHQWLVTYDNSVEIRENFKYVNIVDWEMQYGMNNYKQTTAAKGKELFIANYQINQHEITKNENSIESSNLKQLSLNLFA